MIVYDNSDAMVKWAESQLNVNFGKAVAVGIMKDGKLICVVVWNNYVESKKVGAISLEVSIASIDKSWCNRHNLRELFAYPFIQLRVKRVQATVSKRNKNARKFLHKLGFKFEGIGRKAWHLGGDAAVYSLLKPECKWINYEQKHPLSTSRT